MRSGVTRRRLASWLARALATGLVCLSATAAKAQLATLTPPPQVAAPGADTTAASPLKIETDIFETVDRVSVTVKLRDGQSHTADMLVTHYRPKGIGPFPAVIVSHGRAMQRRNDPARWRYVGIARFFVRRGFAVFVPTRVGYGETGQAVDPESSGACAFADYRSAMAAMAEQIKAAATFAGKQIFVDPKRVLLAGVSYGGFGTLNATAESIPGLVGAINFSGGLGGNPDRRPGDPCQAERIGALAAAAGKASRVPTLWLYAENDKYWGQDWPRRWLKSFVDAGGNAAFEMFPPMGEDGHKLMSIGFPKWRPTVDRFLAGLGFPPPVAATSLPASGYAGLDEADKVPHIKEAARSDGYAKFLASDVPRAFAVAPSGAWAWRSGPDAVDYAMRRCEVHAGRTCQLYAVDDRVVWQPASAQQNAARAAPPAAVAPKDSLKEAVRTR